MGHFVPDRPGRCGNLGISPSVSVGGEEEKNMGSKLELLLGSQNIANLPILAREQQRLHIVLVLDDPLPR